MIRGRPKPRRRWFQFSLRTLLLLAVVGAVLFPGLARWIHGRRECVIVKLTPGGSVVYGGEVLAIEELMPKLRRAAGTLKQFDLTPVLMVEAHVEAPAEDVQRLLEVGSEAGFEKAILAAVEYPMPEQ